MSVDSRRNRGYSYINKYLIHFYIQESSQIVEGIKNEYIVKENEDLLELSEEDCEEDKRAKRISYLIQNHICQETIISKCINLNSNSKTIDKK